MLLTVALEGAFQGLKKQTRSCHQPVFQTGCVEFEKHMFLPGRESLTHCIIKLDYGSFRI